MSKKEEKTNVMRVLDQKKVPYEHFDYDNTKTSAKEICAMLGEPTDKLFKTLVTVAKSKEHYVFMVPAENELDLKKAAKAVGEKNIEMIPQKELLPLTGYIHGGCSPIGMKNGNQRNCRSIRHNLLFCRKSRKAGQGFARRPVKNHSADLCGHSQIKLYKAVLFC